MRLRSKGLGRKEMVMDFREYHVEVDSDELVIVGVIREPVNWDFSIRFCEDDYLALAKLLFNKRSIMAILRAILRRKKKHHWSVDRETHYAEGQKVKEIVRPEIAARVKSAMTPFEEKVKRKRRSATVQFDEESVDRNRDSDVDLTSTAA